MRQGTIDALMAGETESGVRDSKKMVAEIARVVAVGGSFVSISCRWERQETHGSLTAVPFLRGISGRIVVRDRESGVL